MPLLCVHACVSIVGLWLCLHLKYPVKSHDRDLLCILGHVTSFPLLLPRVCVSGVGSNCFGQQASTKGQQYVPVFPSISDFIDSADFFSLCNVCCQCVVGNLLCILGVCVCVCVL
jgi:hypothetical protein